MGLQLPEEVFHDIIEPLNTVFKIVATFNYQFNYFSLPFSLFLFADEGFLATTLFFFLLVMVMYRLFPLFFVLHRKIDYVFLTEVRAVNKWKNSKC